MMKEPRAVCQRRVRVRACVLRSALTWVPTHPRTSSCSGSGSSRSTASWSSARTGTSPCCPSGTPGELRPQSHDLLPEERASPRPSAAVRSALQDLCERSRRRLAGPPVARRPDPVGQQPLLQVPLTPTEKGRSFKRIAQVLECRNTHTRTHEEVRLRTCRRPKSRAS